MNINMNRLRDDSINEVISREGGYVNDPWDSGGETNLGITVAVARAYGYRGEMVDLPYHIAFGIYADRYWNSLHLDEIQVRSESIAEELIDTGINCGVYCAARFLQRSLNTLNHRQKFYKDLKVDGNVGKKTVKALDSYLAKRKGVQGREVLLCMLKCLQGAYYVKLVERREKDEKFIYGWFTHRV